MTKGKIEKVRELAAKGYNAQEISTLVGESYTAVYYHVKKVQVAGTVSSKKDDIGEAETILNGEGGDYELYMSESGTWVFDHEGRTYNTGRHEYERAKKAVQRARKSGFEFPEYVAPVAAENDPETQKEETPVEMSNTEEKEVKEADQALLVDPPPGRSRKHRVRHQGSSGDCTDREGDSPGYGDADYSQGCGVRDRRVQDPGTRGCDQYLDRQEPRRAGE